TTLLDAMAQLESYEACLEIVGSGELETELTAHAKNLGISSRVRFSGSIPHHLLPNKYRSADLFVQSSCHEAQGMALLEAAACGIASAGTPVGILPELAREGAASITRGSHADDLAAAIVDALDTRERMGTRAREMATLEYDLETTCSKWTRLYQETQGGQRKA
ncbi:MAG TPA: glycosyltransferase, partial [Anaerolineae bacterium]